MLLSGDKGILAYINFYLLERNDEIYYHDYSELICKLKLAYSDLDRPVFNLYCLSSGEMSSQNFSLKENNIFFETYEQMKDKIFREKNKTERNGLGRYVSVRNEMGELNELIEIFSDLYRNNVNVS